MTDFSIVGKKTVPMDYYGKVTGRTMYATDISLPGMLYGKILRSSYPHAKIRKIDTSKAEEIPGVKAVITHKDTPGNLFGIGVQDWYILAKDKVRFVGEEIAAVAAIDEETAERALEQIIVKYEELPAVFEPKEAMRPGAPVVFDGSSDNISAKVFVERGDVDQAFADADVIVERTFKTSRVHQGYLEPTAALVEYDRQFSQYVMHIPIQLPYRPRFVYAKALGVGVEAIRIIVPPMGGGFGGKIECNVHLIAALLAKKCGRPVRIVNTREEDFAATAPRGPMEIYMKLGFKKNGTLLGRQSRVVQASGGRTVYSPAIMYTTATRSDSLYNVSNVRNEGYSVYTNTVPTGAYRGFGMPQAIFALETLFDEASAKLGMDPCDLRIKNAVSDGDESVYGYKIKTAKVAECIQRVRKESDWDEKRKAKVPYRGFGLACTLHVSSNRATLRLYDGSGAIVRIAGDGRVLVVPGGEVDMGQGQNTVFAQICAEVLGVPLDWVEVAERDTRINPYGIGSVASGATALGGMAIFNATVSLKEKVVRVVAEALGVEAEEVQIKAGMAFPKGERLENGKPLAEIMTQYCYRKGGAGISSEGSFVPDTQLPDPKTNMGNISPSYPFAAHLVEVEVDPDTGQVKILNYWAAHDSGTIINPLTSEGQVHGGVANALGMALMEDMIIQEGYLQNPNFLDYRIPGSKDLPRINSYFVDCSEPNGPFGAKGLGESTTDPVVAAVANAIYDATGIRFNELPFSAEKILKALRSKQ